MLPAFIDTRTVSQDIRRCAVVARGCNASDRSILYMPTVGNRDGRVLFRGVRDPLFSAGAWFTDR